MTNPGAGFYFDFFSIAARDILFTYAMTRYEKIVLLLVLASLGWQTVPTPGHVTALFFAVWLLALSYLAGGYWLFVQSPVPPGWVRVMAGAWLGVSLTSVVPAIDMRAQSDPSYQAAPIANGILCLALGVYLVLQRRRRGIQLAYQPIFWRSLATLLVCAFLLYTPVTFGPYRTVMLALNRGNHPLTDNLLVFEYAQRRQQALAAQDYEAATRYARQSLAAGKRWLAEDSLTASHKISGAFTNMYETYQTQADTAYTYSKFAKALRLYQAGDRYLLAADTRPSASESPSPFWETEKILSRENMGMCYLRLHQYAKSDSLFMDAIQACKRLPNPSARTFFHLFSELGESLAGERQYQVSNKAYRTAIRQLAPDTARAAAALQLGARLAIAFNTINQDSVPLALTRLQALRYSPTDSGAYYKSQLYQAFCTYRLARYATTRQLLLRCLHAQQRHPVPDVSTLLVCQVLLAKNALALAQYAQTRTYLVAARAQLPAYHRTHGAGAGTSSCLSIEAALNKDEGQYTLAAQQYNELAATNPTDIAGSQASLPETLAELAELNIILDDLPAARTRAEALLALLAASQLPLAPRQTGLLATVAYVNYASGNYAAALTCYRQVLACNKRFNQARSAASATAWNGLGLLATAQHHYPLADSLFRQALTLHQQLFGEQHPATEVVYLNYGQSRLLANDLATAERSFDQAHRIAQAFFSPDHDAFADLDLALGDLAQRRQQVTLAHIYYQQAVAIYLAKFGPTHWKTRLAQRKAGVP